MRRPLIGSVALTLALVACTEPLRCAPCWSGVQIDMTTLQGRATGVRTCLDGVCDTKIRPMPAPDHPTVGISSDKVYDASTVTLELYRGKQFLVSYTGPISVARPSGEGCDCGGSVSLVPGKGSTLVEQQR